MPSFRVKLGHHGIGNKIYGVGDVVEVKNENFAKGDNDRFFEKLDASEAKASESGGKDKRGRKAKGEPVAPAVEDEGAVKE